MSYSSIDDCDKMALNEDSEEHISNLSDPGSIHPKKVKNIIGYSGRSPWYDTRGNHKEAYVVGLCGGSASGKTTVAQSIQSRVKTPWVVILSMDSFYKVLNEEDHIRANNQQYDFDHPNAIDWELARDTILKIKKGKKTIVPIYDFTTHSRLENHYNVIYGADILIVEGILLFCYPELVELLDLKVFISADADLRLCRRTTRDINERGRDLKSVFTQYTRFVKPNFDKYIAPLEKISDIVVPWNNYNLPAVEVLGALIKRNLEDRLLNYKSEIAQNNIINESFVDIVHVITKTPCTQSLHTILRDVKADRLKFAEASNRLMKLVLLEALALQPRDDKSIDELEGKICLVYIIRAGESCKDDIKDIMGDYTQGKIFIQHSQKTGEPEFHFLDLPTDIKDRNILLFDATIASGSAAIMALRVLLDHDVDESKIMLTSLIATPIGINSILSTFPKIKIVTSAIDKEITKNYPIIPGMEDFTDGHYEA